MRRRQRRHWAVLLLIVMLASLTACGEVKLLPPEYSGGSSETAGQDDEEESGGTEKTSGGNGTGSSETARQDDEEESGEERPWLPDPCTALNVSGEYNQSDETYDYYTYDLVADYETMAHFIVVYTEALKNLGYTSRKLNQTGDSVWYQQYTYGDYVGAELAIFVTGDAEQIAGGAEDGWRVVYAVPNCYSFILGNGAPGVRNGDTICIGCGGSGRCAGCGGTGRIKYLDDYEACVICDGSGVCNICDGEGSY